MKITIEDFTKEDMIEIIEIILEKKEIKDIFFPQPIKQPPTSYPTMMYSVGSGDNT